MNNKKPLPVKKQEEAAAYANTSSYLSDNRLLELARCL